MSKEQKYVIICHTGAGNYSTNNESLYKNLSEKACKAVLDSLENDDYSKFYLYNAVTAGLKVLENATITNAGLGSNLTLTGQVECEAGIMCGISGRYGAVGAIKRIKNPIELATKLLLNQLENPVLSLGRCPPNVLVCDGAEKFAVEHGMELIDNSELIIPKRRKKYESCMNMMNSEYIKRNNKRNYQDMNRQDTVGVILVEIGVGIVSASSSGGILLKYDGRLGQSCIYGAGCYADMDTENDANFGSVSTGLGEQLVRTMLPLKTCEFMKQDLNNEEAESLNDDFSQFLQDNFMESSSLKSEEIKSFGILAVRDYCHSINSRSRRLVDILYGHSTPGLCFAVYSSESGLNSYMSQIGKSEIFHVGSLGECFG